MLRDSRLRIKALKNKEELLSKKIEDIRKIIKSDEYSSLDDSVQYLIEASFYQLKFERNLIIKDIEEEERNVN